MELKFTSVDVSPTGGLPDDRKDVNRDKDLNKHGSKRPSRRRFIRNSLAMAAALGAGPAIVIPGRASRKTLRILKWKHFVPEFDRWIGEDYALQWGEANDTKVVVDSIGLGDITNAAVQQARAQEGHDLVLLLSPPSIFENDVIDHREIYEESTRRYGDTLVSALKSTYNPFTNKHFGFCTNIIPAATTYRKDLWESVGTSPDNWDDVRKGGGKIRLLHEAPIGISLAPEHNCEHSMRAILYSYGASIQDEAGRPTVKSPQMLNALKFVKALYEEAMPQDVVDWNAVSNNRYMLSAEGSLTLDTLSIIRAAETKDMPVGDNLGMARLPEGPAGRLGPAFGVDNFIIWKFSKNQEAARQFLVDYIGKSRDALLVSKFQHMPAFTGAVPDLDELLSTDPNVSNSDKYGLLTGVDSWVTSLGYPGYPNSAVIETLNSNLISRMFASVATGAMTAVEAMNQGAEQAESIFAKHAG